MGIKEVWSGFFRRPESRPVTAEGKKVYSEVSLNAEWQEQARRLAGLFATALGKTEEEYISELPKFEPQPKQFKGRFDVPIIVETRVPLKRMLELAGINKYFDVDSIRDWERSKFNTPKIPYTTWLNDGSVNLNKSVDTVRKALKADERGGTVFDGIILCLKDPKILEHHYLDLPGSQVGSDNAPCLGRWYGQPGLDLSFVGDGNPRYGSVVAGKL